MNDVILEEVADLVRQKTFGQLPKSIWDMLQLFQFREGEEALRLLREYLESMNGQNARFLNRL